MVAKSGKVNKEAKGSVPGKQDETPEPEKKKRVRRVMTTDGMGTLNKITVAANAARVTIIETIGDGERQGRALINSTAIGHTEAFSKMEAVKNILQSVIEDIAKRRELFDEIEAERVKEEKRAKDNLAVEIKETEAKLAALKGKSAPAGESQGDNKVG